MLSVLESDCGGSRGAKSGSFIVFGGSVVVVVDTVERPVQYPFIQISSRF